MFRMQLAFVLCLSSALAASDPVRVVTSEAEFVGNQGIPAFYKGYLYFIEEGHDSQFRLYAPDGHLALAGDIQGQKSGRASVSGMAVDTDGTAAVSWYQTDAAHRFGGGIDFLDLTGKQLGSIDTGRYLPTHLYYAEDHVLWSFGDQMDAVDSRGRDRHDYMTLRRYTPDRKEAGAYLPRSLFSEGLPPGGLDWQKMRIAVSHDRVEVLAYSGDSGPAKEWVELDLNGKVIRRWTCERKLAETYLDQVVLTTDGHLYAQGFDREAKTHRLFQLDRASSKWKEVDGPPRGNLYAADGEELVFTDILSGPIQLRWFSQPAGETVHAR